MVPDLPLKCSIVSTKETECTEPCVRMDLTGQRVWRTGSLLRKTTGVSETLPDKSRKTSEQVRKRTRGRGVSGPGSSQGYPAGGFWGLFASRAQEGEGEGINSEGSKTPNEHLVNEHLSGLCQLRVTGSLRGVQSQERCCFVVVVVVGWCLIIKNHFAEHRLLRSKRRTSHPPLCWNPLRARPLPLAC